MSNKCNLFTSVSFQAYCRKSLRTELELIIKISGIWQASRFHFGRLVGWNKYTMETGKCYTCLCERENSTMSSRTASDITPSLKQLWVFRVLLNTWWKERGLKNRYCKIVCIVCLMKLNICEKWKSGIWRDLRSEVKWVGSRSKC